MTEDEIKEYLKSHGWPKQVWEIGSKYLLERWRQFASTVGDREGTRNWLIDDYWISLRIRELIHETGLDHAVKEDDNRFRSALTATNIKHQHTERNTTYDFWNFGYPQNATGYFYEQIKLHILEPYQNDK